jgi:hypothetical protein
MHTGNKHILAVTLVALFAAGPMSLARAEVLSLRIGLTPSCPYGLAA